MAEICILLNGSGITWAASFHLPAEEDKRTNFTHTSLNSSRDLAGVKTSNRPITYKKTKKQSINTELSIAPIRSMTMN